MSKYVPVTKQWDEGEPLGIEGEVVGVLAAQRATRRTTLLVKVPDEHDGDVDEGLPQGVEVNFDQSNEVPDTEDDEEDGDTDLEDLGYRELQDKAKERGIKANQSTEDLIEAIRNE